jgi:hypothetical protein
MLYKLYLEELNMFSYKKKDNSLLFNKLEDVQLTNISKPQNYIPLYNNFFSLTETNYNKINLDNTLTLFSIHEKCNDNNYKGIVVDNSLNKHDKDIFFKYSPLLDPVKYMIGKYDLSNVNIVNLPSFIPSLMTHAKVNDPNNAAYVDSFFTHLTSKLLHNYHFIHGLDFYGSFLGIKNDFNVNVYDDIDYMNDSSFFHKNNGTLFTFETDLNIFYSNNECSRNYKKRLIFHEGKDESQIIDESILGLADIKDLSALDAFFNTSNENNENNENNETLSPLETANITSELNEVIFDNNSLIPLSNNKINGSATQSSGSSCSSRSSNTDNDNDDEDSEEEDSEDDNEDEDNDGENDGKEDEEEENEGGEEEENEGGDDENDGEDDEKEDEEELFAKIKQFPVHVIALEKCNGTLDSLMMKDELEETEWDSAVIQILMMLSTFQEKFNLTHNDLHSNNIMYTKTDIEFLYYKLKGIYYKVPTFGRIYKIIDFGRAIYKFRGKLMCSDSFHKKGDASTQYNFEPYFNTKKPRLEPNYSFDLCRLGCALFDFIMEKEENDSDDINDIKTPIFKIIAEWCKDDKGRNILYKTNGDERYPDFKLYKMIVRTVHKHIPTKVLENTYFDKYIINKKKMKVTSEPKNLFMDIDAIPCFMGMFN